MWWVVTLHKSSRYMGLTILSSSDKPVTGVIEGTNKYPGQWGGDMEIRSIPRNPHALSWDHHLDLKNNAIFRPGRLYLITSDPVPPGTYRPHTVTLIRKSKELPLWIGEYCTEKFYQMIKEIR